MVVNNTVGKTRPQVSREIFEAVLYALKEKKTVTPAQGFRWEWVSTESLVLLLQTIVGSYSGMGKKEPRVVARNRHKNQHQFGEICGCAKFLRSGYVVRKFNVFNGFWRKNRLKDQAGYRLKNLGGRTVIRVFTPFLSLKCS
jgi:hypothetical protein